MKRDFSDFSLIMNSGKTLTDLFYTSAFSGSWEVFSKFNWLGYLLQFIISAFCLIGLFMTGYQILVTMLYLSARNLFDRIHELKEAGKGGKALGLPNLFRDNIAVANNGTGLDAIVSFFLTLLPDVKAYSDYGPGRRRYNLQDDDTITTFMLKIALPTIMMVFFFSIGFNGTLFKSYGMVVDAMAAVADEVVDTDLTRVVHKWMNSGSAYKFAYDADGSEYGKFRQKMAETMYSKMLAKTDNLTTDAKLYIGQRIEQYINNNVSISEGFVGSAEVPGFKGTDKDCKNLQISVTINGTATYAAGTVNAELNGGGITVDNFGVSGEHASEYYMHVFITRERETDETDFFEVDRNEAADGTGDSPSGGGNAPTGY